MLVGRDDDLRRIGDLLERARSGTAGALVLRGEAGIGKTSLLAAAARSADGFTRLVAHGVESESAMAYAALLQLLAPLRHHLDRVPPAQVKALEAALGWGAPDAVGDRYLVAAATLSLLGAAAEDAPLLVVIDDLHWLDLESAAAVLFAARRLTHDAVAVLLATRHGSPPGTALDGLPVLQLRGLAASEATGVLPPGTTAAVAARLVTATGGNPLALREAGTLLSPAQRRGAELPDPLPAGDRLHAVYEPVLASLTPACRRVVLLVAVAQDESIDPVLRAARADGVDPDGALGEAEARGVVVREPGVVRFRHPLLRTATLAASTPAERRAAHAGLAAALPDSLWRSRTWHQAEAATGPDDELAARIEAVAMTDRERRGYAAASAGLERAARLSTDPAHAADLLAGAVEDAALGGDAARARALAEGVISGEADSAARGRALAALGSLEQVAGSIPQARRFLEQAAELTTGRLRVRVLADLAQVCFRLNDFSGLAAAAERTAAVADEADPEQRLLSLYLRGVVAVAGPDPATGRRLLTATLDLLDADPGLRDDVRHLVVALQACSWVPLTPELVESLERRLALARDRGAFGVLVSALALAAHGRAFMGDHEAAFAEAGEAVELARELGYVADAAPALELLAWHYAARGLHDDARAALDRSAALVERAGTVDAAAHLALARAFCALCRDDLDEVVALLESRLAVDGGRGASGEPLGVAPLLVEAYVGLGRSDDARRLTDRYAAVPQPDGRTAALIARCQGLTAADHPAAVAAFDASLRAHDRVADVPFERANTELLYGARLRRFRQRVAARQHLRTARDRFEGMALDLYVDRANAELAATGETARRRQPYAVEPLTSQETRIALLVGRGLTNREVAAALFLSPKTVEHHLSSIYRKRGLRSRTELAHSLTHTPPDSSDQPPA